MVERLALVLSDEFVHANRRGLTEIHGRMTLLWTGMHGDRHEPVAMAHGIVAEACFLRTEEQRHARGCQCGLQLWRAIGQGEQGMLSSAVSNSRRADDEAAVGYRLSDTREFSRRGE